MHLTALAWLGTYALHSTLLLTAGEKGFMGHG